MRSYLGSYLGMMASLARSACAPRISHTSSLLFDDSRPKSVIRGGIQSTLSDSSGETLPVVPPRKSCLI